MNCLPTQCGMTVEVEGNTLLSLKGDRHNPDSQGFLCMRGQATREIFANPRRLLHPLRRAGERGEDRWEVCSWDEAYTLMANAIQQTKPERVGLWRGHGTGTTGPGANSLLSRFGLLGGFQQWSTSMVCWAMGGYGLGLTGTLRTSTKEDMATNARTIVLWGATLASQPDLGPQLVEARKRGARVLQIDTRRTEVSRHANEVFLVPPGSDAALALALAQVIVAEGWQDQDFLDRYTLGFAELVPHLQRYTPEWASPITRLAPERIRELARLYATETPSVIVLGGSSLFKHQHGWEPARAISCLPALIGQLGKPGGGMGQRHGASPEGVGLADVLAGVKGNIPAEAVIPSHMASITTALNAGKLDVMLIFGSNMLSTFPDSNELARGLAQVGLIVAYDLFMNDTARRTADLILPATAWLEDIGMKQTATHIYLMERALDPAGECRSLITILRELSQRLALEDVFPWRDEEEYLNAFFALQKTAEGRPLTVEILRQRGGYWPKNDLVHVAYQDHQFATPSGKVEFWSERARLAGLAPLPSYTAPAGNAYPLRFCQGRTLTAFHSFFDQGQALPTLARANPGPQLWIHPQDAQQRSLVSGSTIIVSNQRGQFEARALVTDDILPGAVWMRDGWTDANRVTSGEPTVSLAANDIVPGIPGGQAAYEAWVEVQAK
jgi:anaerobic selenocysteine-containing dehydrogenase